MTGSRILLFWLLAIFFLAGLMGCQPTNTSSIGSVEPELTSSLLPPELIVTQAPDDGDTMSMETPTLPPLGFNTPSPGLDGLWVVYSLDGELWIWSKGEKRRLATQGPVFSPRISPDGSKLAFLRPIGTFSMEMWVKNLEATGEQRLVSIADLEAIGGENRDPNAVAIIPHRFQWLPDGNTLAFNTEYAYQGPGTVLLDDFNLVDADTGQLRYQFLPGWGGEFFLSPAGNQVAFSTPENVILANLDGTNWRIVLAYQPVITYSDYRFYAEPFWSPDGRYLFLAIPPGDPLAATPEPTRLILIEVDSSSASVIGQVASLPFFDSPVQYSPDRNQIAFLTSSGDPQDNRRSLFFAGTDGSGSTEYHTGEALRYLGWNPSGDLFGFSLGIDQELYLGSINSPTKNLGTTIFGVIALRWVNENHFLFQQGIGEQNYLCLGGTDGEVIILDTGINSRIDYDFFLRE